MVFLRKHTLSMFGFVLLLAAGLMLTGCPKKPQVGEAESGAVGAVAQPAPAAPGAGAGPAAGAGTTPERVPAQPGVGAGTGTAPAAPSAAGTEPRPQAAIPGAGVTSAAPGAPGAGAAAGAPAAPAAAAGRPGAPGAVAESPLKDVFFDTDKSAIKSEAKAALDEDVKWLKSTAATVVIEGHCDERGTVEYNLALGERRSKATRDYLVAAGIDAKRLSTVSYGKERPFVLGHDEEAWKWNRRAHFVVK